MDTYYLVKRSKCFINFNQWLLLGFVMLLITNNSRAQCYSAPGYCVPTFTNINSYSIGIQNTTLTSPIGGASINNTSVATGNAPNYFDYTTQVVSANASTTVTGSVKNGSSNSTTARIFIDYNQDGVFGTSAPELVWSSATTTSNAVVAVSFTIPVGQASGAYRMRVTGDIGGSAASPCALGYGEAEDYKLLVPAASVDVVNSGLTSPSFFLVGNNSISFSFSNISTTTITSIDIGYQLDANTPVTQSLTGLSVAGGGVYTATFSAVLNLPSISSYGIKIWVTNPNGAGSVTPANDTICRSFVTYCSSALSGTYTIDPAGSGPANFTRFGAADSALLSCGISGPVVFNVAAGTYVEQVFFGPVTGASSTNTITFDGGTGNVATRILSYNFTGTPTNYGVLHLNGADYFRFNNLTIKSTSTTYGYGVLLSNQADNNIIDNCIIDLSSVTSTSATNSAGINFSSVYNTTSNSANHGNNNMIRNCQIKGGASGGPYRGINLYGSSTTQFTNSNNQFVNNTITDFYESGIYMFYYLDGTVIWGNSISRPARTASTSVNGIYINQYFTNTTVEGNKIFNPFGGALTSASQFTAMYLTNGSTTGGVNVIRNNAIYNINGVGVDYGIYDVSNYAGLYVYNNTISFDFATAKTNANADYGIYFTYGSTGPREYINNIITMRRGGIGTPNRYGFYISDYNTGLTSNNNLFLVSAPASNNITVFQTGANYTSLAAWKASNNNQYDQSSIGFDPVYANLVTNPTPTSCGLNNLGTPVSGVTTDINGTTRGSVPDIGAYEFSVAPAVDNAALTGLDATTSAMCPGGISAVVVLRNDGTSNLTSAAIDWKVNGASQTQYLWSGTLAPGASTNVTIGTAVFVANSANTLSVYISSANGNTDGCAFNDTLIVAGTASMSGAYTINASGSGSANFTTFALAVSALSSRGVCGPVVFNVAAGTYTQQVVIPFIAGSSAVNTITFNGAGAASTILTFAAASNGSHYTVRFDNSQWIRLYNLTIQGTGATYSWPIHIYNHSSNLKIRNCIIKSGATLTSQTTVSFTGIAITNSTSSLTTQTNSSNIDIDSNSFLNNWYAISIIGSSTAGMNPNINIRSNRIDSVGLYGIFENYPAASKINDNIINMRIANGASATSYGIYLSNAATTSTDNIQVNRNIIRYCTQFGISLNIAGGSASTQRAQMINNSIGGGFTNIASSGINFTSSTYWDVWFNSVNISNAATGTAQCIYLSTGAATFCDIRNNNFAVTNSGATGAVAFRSAAGATTLALNYNNYYKAGAISTTTIIAVLGTNYTPTTFNTALAGGLNSINQNSSFTATTNLLPTVTTNNGQSNVSVPADVLGTYRNSPPDVGAYEVASTASVDLGVVSLVTPDTILPIGSQNVSVVIRNFGSTTITSLNLRHTVNGGNLQDTAITGISLAQNSSLTIEMGSTKQATFALGLNTFNVYVHLPNGSLDNNQLNDTLIIGPKYPAISGVFTINPGGSGSGNFTSFTNAVTALSGGAVNGPVLFNVAAATYPEQISIPNIIGSSAINTITFDGGNGNAATRILTFPGTTANPATIRLNGSANITIRNLTVTTTGASEGWGVNFYNTVNCRLNNSVVNVSGTGATSTSSNFQGINICGGNANANYTTASTVANNNVVDSCTINAGYYSIYSSINNGTLTNYFNYNTLNNAYNAAASFNSAQTIKFVNNTVSLRTTNNANYGLYFTNCNPASNQYHDVRNNKILNAGQYGIYLTSSAGSALSYGQIYNNFIGGGFRNLSGYYGIYMTSSTRYKIWNNSFNLDFASTSGTTAAIYLAAGGSMNDIQNNHLSVSSTSAINAYPLYTTLTSNISVLNNNNYYNKSSSILLSIAGVNYTSANYRTTYPSGGGASSMNTDPFYISGTNLHTTASCNNGFNLGLSADFDGETRTSTPDIGADEVVTVPNNDIGIYRINSPLFPLSVGSQNINVTIKNYGNNTVTAANFNYSVNGGIPITEAWTGSLNACDTLNFTFTSPYTFTSGATNLKVFTTSPNSVTDAVAGNDTAQYTLCPAMSGTYTIGASGNYTSFAAALSALNCGGVNGPVTFLVSAGTYTGQMMITSVNGSSATNAITFKSATNNASDVILNYSSTGAVDNFIVMLSGCSYVNFDNITFAPLGVSFGNAVVFTNTANNNSIDSCVFNGLSTSSTSSNLALIFSNGTKDNSNTISNSIFNNASSGIYWISNSSTYAASNQILKNTFNNQYYSAIYTQYHDYLRIKQNVILASTGYTGYNGIYLNTTYNTSGPSEVTRNKVVVSIGGGAGIYIASANAGGNLTNRFLLANNMVRVNVSSNTQSYGIYTSSGNYTDVIHNTVNIVGQPTGTSYGYYNSSFVSPACYVQNNVFVNSTVGAAAISYAVFESVSTAGTWNNNNYYSTGTNLGFWTTAKATLALWQAAGSQDAASFNKYPVFVSSSDLHFSNLPCLNNTGANLFTKVADDFDGTARTTSPDIGAAEFTPISLDATVIAVRAPSGSLTVSTAYNVVVTVSNLGANTINTLVVGYSVNGGTALTQTLSSLTLNPCDTLQVTFNSTSGPGSSDQRYVALAGLVGVQTFTSAPNSGSDLNTANDTLAVSFCTPFSGAFTIDGSLPASSTNFPTFAAAKNALSSCGGITGPVVFNVAAGTYSEQIDLTAITGASATNTITFDGGTGNAATRILNNSSTASNSLHTLRINSANYIYIRNITIRCSNGAYGWPLHIYGSSSNLKIKNCIIDFVGSGLAAVNDNFDGIVVNNYAASASPSSGSWTGTNIEIDSNRILGGNNSIYVYGNNTNTGVYLRSNRADSAYTYGIYVYNLPLMKLNYNTISMGNSGSINSYGIYLNTCNASASNYHEVSGNKIINCGYVGIYLTGSNGQASPRSQMFNNAIGGGFRNSNPSGISFSSSSYNWDVLHNSVNLDNLATGGSSGGIYVGQCCTTGSTLLDIRNNIFAVTTTGSTSYPIYFSNGGNYAVSSTSTLNYNLYYKAGITTSQPFLYLGGVQTLTNFVNNGNYNANSFAANPGFTGAKNIQPYNPCNKVPVIAAVTTDLNGTTRSVTPNVGSFEVSPTSLDLGIENITYPVAPFNSGPQNITVVIRNYGSSTITSANISYSVNGGVPVTAAFTGSILPCSTATFSFTGVNQYNFSAGTTYAIKAWPSNPNGGADAVNINDTASIPSIGTALSGTYTINPSSPVSSTNFQSFTAAANALNASGVGGPVIFNVAGGTYTEQFTLQVSGTSAVNTITFQSVTGLASSVVLQYSAQTSTANNYIVYMNGASYVSFNNMTMQNLNASYGTIIWQLNNSRYNTFQNIIFNGVSTTSTSTNLSLVYANNASAVNTSQGDDNNTFNQCAFNNGSYGIYYNGQYSPYYSYNTVITNNTFTNQYYTGLYFYFHLNMIITNNIISTNSTYTGYTGINAYQGGVSNSGVARITNNKITAASANGYGLYLQYYIGTNTLVANNMVNIGSGTGTSYALYGQYAQCKIYNNTFNVTSGSTTTPAVYLYNASYSPAADFRYNIVANSGNGSASGLCIYSFNNSATYILMDSNVYYQGAGAVNFGTFNLTSYTTFALWKAGMGVTYDPNSLVANPSFVSSTDLHINSATNLKSMAANSLVPNDIDNTTRCSTTDVGADHHPASNNIGVSSVFYPYNGVAGTGTRDLQVYIRNYGGNTITSANVSYTDNSITKTVAWTGSLVTCDSVLVTFTGTNQYTFSGAFSLKFYTDGPNGNADMDALNDTIQTSGCTGMAGSFTIDPAGSGPTNYTTFALAVAAMQSCGIGGPVTFNVAAATFSEQISIPNISGSSATNTITFEGGNGNASTRILTFATGISFPYVVRFNACKYVTFRNITIRSTGAVDAWVAHFLNGNDNRVNNCIIEITGAGATATTGNLSAVVINGHATTLSTVTSLANNITIDSCTLNAGYYNVYNTMNVTSNVLTVFSNTLNSAYNYGYYCTYTCSPRIRTNTVNLRTTITNNYGIWMQSCNNTGSDYFEISGNRIPNPGLAGIYLNSCSNSGSANNKIYNNTIGGGFRNVSGTYGIYLSSCTKSQVYHNSINLDIATTGGVNAAIYINSGSLNDIRNNHLVVSNAAALGAYPLYISAAGVVSICDYNNYYNRSGTSLLNIGGTNYTSSNYRAAYSLGGGLNSINTDPSYVSTSNLHVTAPCNNGVYLGITTDVDGEARTTTPDIGADEVVSVPNNDIGVISINSPVFPLSAGSQAIAVTIKNFGNNIVTAANFNYSVNGGSVITEVWTGTLNPCATLDITLATPYIFTSGASNLKVFTTLPNSVSDANTANDTSQVSLCLAMSGTYTIGASGNYTTFTAAINALSCGGINGPVNFIVSAGTYTERINILPINGSSAVNTITFRSATNNAADVILSYSSTVADNSIVALNGCSYVNFDNISFAPLGVSYGTAVVITNGANFNTIDSCIFNGLNTSSSTTNLALIFSNNTKDNNNTISNTTFNNGAYGIYWSSNTSLYAAGNQILKNTFNNQYSCGIYAYYHDYLRIKQNTINASTSYTGYYGISMQNTFNTSGSSEITRNKIIVTIAGGYGIYNYYPNQGGNSTNRFLFANNMVQVNVSSANTSYGIYNQYAYYIDVMHNTVNIAAQPTGTSYAFYNSSFYSASCFVQNNVFVNSTVGAAAISYAVFESVSTAGTWNNNNYYSTGTNLGFWTTAKATLALWQATGSQDAASFNKQPVFTSSSDLHFSNLPCLNNTGANVLTKVADDFDGNARTTTPDIGAAELTIYSLDAAVVAMRAPSGALTVANPYDVVVTITNRGTSVLNSVVVGYIVNGGTPVTQSLSSLTLNPCDTLQVTFNATSGPGASDQRYVALGGLVGVQAYTASPNSGTDLLNSNDTISVNFCTPFAGTFTIDASLPASASNFQSFTAAKNALSGCGGITGPVVFNVAAGTYNEQVDISAITGASATNTITFDGGTGNASTRILSFASVASNALHTLRINNAQYIYINNITIRGAGGTYGWPLHIYGSSSNIKIRNCIIDFTGNGLNATNDNFDGIVVNNYAASASPGGGMWTGTNIEIDSNRILGGNNSVYFYGNSASANLGVYFRNNRCDSAYTYGVYSYYIGQLKFNNNSISMRTTGSINSYGIYLNQCSAAPTYYHEVNGNKIINCGLYGVNLSSSNGQSSPRCQFFNNTIGGGFRNTNPAGIYTTSYSWDIYHNSVNLDNVATGTSSACLYFATCCTTGSTLLDVRNNIFAVTATGSSSYIDYYANAGSLNYHIIGTANMDYNIYYKAGMTSATPLFYLAGSSQTMGNVIGNGGYNTNSILVNPGFTSSTNLQPSNACTRGTNIAAVTTDFNGTTRNNPPSAGAFEVSQPALDMGVDNITSPAAPFSPGLQNITVVLRNFGSSTITSADINYSVNGGTPVTAAFSGSLTPCSITPFTFTGGNQFNFAPGTSYTIKAWTSTPNGGTDATAGNDSAIVPVIGAAMSGTYTINPSSPASSTNFQSFTAAAAALNAGGVNGPVIINVASGTFTEQFNLRVLGTSAINTITIQSTALNAAVVTLQFNATSAANNFVVNLNGTSYTTIRYLTFAALNATYGNVLTVNGGASYNTFQNNIFNGVSTSSTSAALNVINFNGTAAATENYNTFTANNINNGSGGISLLNSNTAITGNIIQNNTISNQYSSGISCNGTTQYNLTINANVITTNSAYTNYYGINLSNITTNSANSLITKNKITGAVGGYGIYCNSVYSNAPNYVLFANNFIQIGASGNTAYGMYLGSMWNNKVYNNSVNVTSGSVANSYALYWTGANTPYTEVKFNVFANTGNGSTAGYAVYSNTNNTSALKLDSNNYYTGNGATNFGNYNGTPQATFAAWKTAIGTPFDVNSINANPAFISQSDLHISATGSFKGSQLSMIADDIDGEVRQSSPDIGADEYYAPLSNNTISSAQSICSGNAPSVLSGSVPSGGTGIYSYTWLSSGVSATSGYAAANGTNNTQNYSPSIPAATTWYRRLVTSGLRFDTSSAIAITINKPLASLPQHGSYIFGADANSIFATASNWYYYDSIAGYSIAANAPGITDKVVISPVGTCVLATPTITNNAIFNDLAIESGAILDLSNIQATITGSISGLGLIKGGAGTLLTINGSGTTTLKMDQTTPGTTNRLQNLIINRGTSPGSGGLNLGNMLELTGTLTLSNGTLTTGGNLTLVSNGSGTARVASIPANADISGNVISQRFIPAVARRYRTISPNTSSFTFADLVDDMFLTGPGGATNGFDPTPSNSNTAYTYQESTTGGRGWKGVPGISTSLSAGQGALVFVRGDRTLASPDWYTTGLFPSQNSVNVDFNGQLNKGTISPTITYTNTTDTAADGWNLVGNPYASQIDWNTVSKSGLDGNFWTFDPSTGSYYGNNTGVIASGQAFFVHAISASPAITFNESDKVSGAPANFFKTGNPKITARMIKDSLTTDLTELEFVAGSSKNYIPTEDIIKMYNSSMNFGITSSNNFDVQKNAIPPILTVSDTVRLFAFAPAGQYTLNFSGASSLSSSYSVYLMDMFTSTTQDLRTNPNYTFNITSNSASSGYNRFRLIFVNPSALPVKLIDFYAGKDVNRSSVQLHWRTSSENNSSRFVIERSADNATEFNEIGVVGAKGNSTGEIGYQFDDIDILKANHDIIYYRLKQIDKDGSSQQSQIVSVRTVNPPTETLVYPNPATSIISIRPASGIQGNVHIEIYDIVGKLSLSKDLFISKGQDINLDVSTLQSGVYIISYSQLNAGPLNMIRFEKE